MGRSRKDPHSPHRGNFYRPEGRGEKIVSDNSKCIRISEGGRGLTFNFLCGSGMDVFGNDPIHQIARGLRFIKKQNSKIKHFWKLYKA